MNKKLLITAFLTFLLISPIFAFASDNSKPNLISNPQLETPDPLDNSKPQDWLKGVQWGSNIPSYVYPYVSTTSSDISSGNAVAVSFDAYTGTPDVGGDAKWYFTPVPVLAGRQYLFNNSYISDLNSYLTAEYFDANHVHISYGGFFVLPPTPANTWKSSSAVFTTPVGAAYMTVFHSIQGVGRLITDSFNLKEIPLPLAFNNAFVSLTFDDGYVNHLTNAKPVLDSGNVKATYYIVSHVSGFSVKNPSFENVNVGTGLPEGWTSNTPTGSSASYPVSGHTGSKAAELSSTILNTGASWNFSPITVLADEDFSYSEYYKSTTVTDLYVEINTVTGTKEYIDSTGAVVLTKTPFLSGIAASPSWTKLEANFYLPPTAKSVVVTHTLSGIGSLAIDDINLGAFNDFMNPEQIKSLQTSGIEIGGHTQTHANLTAIAQSEVEIEVTEGRNDLINGGISGARSFAYPYGNFNDTTKQIVKNAGYTSGRTVLDGLNGKNSDKYALLSKSVNKDTTIAQVKSWIDDAVTQKRWLILVFHQVQTDLSSVDLTYGTTPAILGEIIAYLNTANVPVLTVDQGVALMDGSDPIIDPVAPTIDSHVDITSTATSSVGVNVSYVLPSARDSKNTSLVPSCNPISGSMFVVGTTTVQCSVVDSNNLTATSSFKIIVTYKESIDPTPTPTPTPTVILSGGGGVSSNKSSTGRSSGSQKRFTILDFNKLVINLGNKGVNVPGDFNFDGVVDILDFNILITNWAK